MMDWREKMRQAMQTIKDTCNDVGNSPLSFTECNICPFHRCCLLLYEGSGQDCFEVPGNWEIKNK